MHTIRCIISDNLLMHSCCNLFYTYSCFLLVIIKNALFFVVLRDILEHGRDIDNVLSQYTRFVKPAFEDFTLPVCRIYSPLNDQVLSGFDNIVLLYFA